MKDNATALTRARQMHYRDCAKPYTLETTMPATLEAESTLTDRYQTTVPETVRRALRLHKRDKIQYVIRPSGPERLQSLNSSLVQRAQSLVGEVNVDLDAPLSDEDG